MASNASADIPKIEIVDQGHNSETCVWYVYVCKSTPAVMIWQIVQ